MRWFPLVISLLAFTAGAGAQESRPEFGAWLETIRAEALSTGLKPETVALAFDGLTPLDVVVERDRSQAEVVLPIDTYIKRRLTPAFVRTARTRAGEHRRLLAEVGKRYAVQPRFLVAVWGIESNFGRFTGVRPTVQALATLAWEGRRGAFFKGELFNALQMVDRGHIELAAMKGSWAGAMGQTQFMPSSYLAHAQDFDGDGRRDIWSSLPDVFASIADYLRERRWSPEVTWGREVRAPAGGAAGLMKEVGLREQGCRAEREMSVRLPLKRWQALGVRTIAGGALPAADLEASLVAAGRQSYLVYSNYEALLGYNCAHAYALTVGLLADRIDRR
jgi:membrane-bound lytic murein transglycosylase B